MDRQRRLKTLPSRNSVSGRLKLTVLTSVEFLVGLPGTVVPVRIVLLRVSRRVNESRRVIPRVQGPVILHEHPEQNQEHDLQEMCSRCSTR